MRTKTVKVTIPEISDCVAGLDPRTLHPALAHAERTAEDAQRALDEARANFDRLERETRAVAAAVQAGRASVDDLDRVQLARDRAALVIAPAERAAAEAQAALERERAAAIAKVRAEERKRADQLAATARQLLDAIETVEDCELTLARHVARATGSGAVGWHSGYMTPRAQLTARNAAEEIPPAKADELRRAAATEARRSSLSRARKLVLRIPERIASDIAKEHDAARVASLLSDALSEAFNALDRADDAERGAR